MFLITYMECFYFGTLAYDGRAKNISTQTIVALTASLALSTLNLPKAFSSKVHKLIVVFVGCLLGSLASWQVAKDSQADGEDDLRVPGVPQKASKAVIYVGAIVMGILSLLISCRFSPTELQNFIAADFQSPVCTFQNFLHAFALLPQLVLCRRQGFVSPAGVRFLFLLGTKHLYEFISDAYVSYKHYLRGRLSFHEFSFMFGDFVAAVILLDFLYLVLVDERSVQLLLGSKEMELRDEEAPFHQEEKKPTSRLAGLSSLWAAARTSLAEPRNKQLAVFAASAAATATIAVSMGLINVYACIAAAALFGAYRVFHSLQDAKFQLPSKADKCCSLTVASWTYK